MTFKRQSDIIKADAHCVVANTEIVEQTSDGPITNNRTVFYIANDALDSRTAVVVVGFAHTPKDDGSPDVITNVSVSCIPRNCDDELSSRPHYLFTRAKVNTEETRHVSTLLGRDCGDGMAYVNDTWHWFNLTADERIFRASVSSLQTTPFIKFKIGPACAHNLIRAWDVIKQATEHHDGTVSYGQLSHIGGDSIVPSRDRS